MLGRYLNLLQVSVLGGSQHNAVTVLGGCRWRRVEVEDARLLLVVTVLVAQLLGCCHRCKRLYRPSLLLEALLRLVNALRKFEVRSITRSVHLLDIAQMELPYRTLLQRHVPHESALGGLHLIEKLPLVVDLDRKHLGGCLREERIVVLQLGFQTFVSIHGHLNHLGLELGRWAQLRCKLLVVGALETLHKFRLLLRPCLVLLEHDDHLRLVYVFLIECGLTVHFDDLADLVLRLACVSIKTA